MFHILIIDDNEDFCEYCADALKQKDFEVTVVHTSLEALRLVSSTKFHGLVVDNYLPDINGVQLIAYIKSSFLNANTPIVTVSGEFNPVHQERMMRLGVLACLSKPVEAERIVELLSHSLGATRLAQKYNSILVNCATDAVKETMPNYVGEDAVTTERGVVVSSAVVHDVISYIPIFGPHLFGSLVMRSERRFLEDILNRLFGQSAAGITLEAIGDLGAEINNQLCGNLRKLLWAKNIDIILGMPNTAFGVARSHYHFVANTPLQFQVLWKGSHCKIEFAMAPCPKPRNASEFMVYENRVP